MAHCSGRITGRVVGVAAVWRPLSFRSPRDAPMIRRPPRRRSRIVTSLCLRLKFR
jgi:hypothetical protein